jgi:hypothetical protein
MLVEFVLMDGEGGVWDTFHNEVQRKVQAFLQG